MGLATGKFRTTGLCSALEEERMTDKKSDKPTTKPVEPPKEHPGQGQGPPQTPPGHGGTPPGQQKPEPREDNGEAEG